MTFNLPGLLLISIAYLLLLFGIAWATEHGYMPRRIIRHPLIYVLSLGVYASAWTFYGTVSLANLYGYGYLASYLGISGAFLLAPVLLYPILRITRTYQLSSLADVFAFRFRSGWAGALTTLLMLIGILPLLALQFQAVANSISVLTQAPEQRQVALGYCGVILLFTMLFGARHIATREKHEGLVLAIAFESLIKLIALCAVGLYAFYTVFGSPAALDQWLTQNTAILTLDISLQDGPWRTLLLVFFASAIVMPHMYHMTFTENLRPQSMRIASWGLPLLLLLMSLSVPVILWASIKLGVDANPDYYPLALSMALENKSLALLIYIGGLSASSGLIIVATLALSGMVLNHLVLPLYQPPAKVNIYRWLKWTRRLLIFVIILGSYLFYRVIDTQHDLSTLGIIAFSATLQFLPGVLAVLYWSRANRKGFISGLVGGFGAWIVSMLLPLLLYIDSLHIPFLDQTYVLGHANWHTAALTSLAINATLFIVVSLLTRASDEERGAAEACIVNDTLLPQRLDLEAMSAQDFALQLAKPLGPRTAQQEVEKALHDLQLPFDERRPYALRRLRDRIEANLSGLMGPHIARDIVKTFLPYKAEDVAYISGDIHFIENSLEDYHLQLTGLAAELDTLRRYHRHTLQELPIGVCSLAKDREILMWNRAMEKITGLAAKDVVGLRLQALGDPWRTLLVDFINRSDYHLYKHQLELDATPRWLSLHKAAIAEPLAPDNNGLVLLVEDLTETQLLEDKLVHSERLASIGRLAAGVAHEIGNPVTGIACLAQNLREERDSDGELQEVSGQILEQTGRISRIVQSLMNFAHSGKHQRTEEPVNLFEAARDAIALLELNRQSQDVHFFNFCDPEHLVSGDPQRLVQVLINLLSNARDASPVEGSIYVTSKAGRHIVELIVEDEGPGISAAIREQLFEPFFTTKEPGKGTGLGLSLVYSIVKEHYGQIAIDSPSDSQRQTGTRFRITLPRYVQETSGGY